jgi:hypothetical protein
MSATGKSVSFTVPSRYSRVRTAASRPAPSGPGLARRSSTGGKAFRDSGRDDAGLDGIEVDFT